jgi:hypothetical protein
MMRCVAGTDDELGRWDDDGGAMAPKKGFAWEMLYSNARIQPRKAPPVFCV